MKTKPTHKRKRGFRTPHCHKLNNRWKFYFITTGTLLLLVCVGHMIPTHWQVGIEGGIVGLGTKLGEGFRGEE